LDALRRQQRWFTFSAVVAVSVAASASSSATSLSPSTSMPNLPPAETWADQGVAPGLEAHRGAVRVRIVAASQPLLQAASRAPFVRSDGRAGMPRPRPHTIALAEIRRAEVAEASYERA
jgi:hypothetical protein